MPLARKTYWALVHKDGDASGDWPVWVPIVSLAIVLVTGTLTLALRHSLLHPRAATLYVLLASVPFLLDAVGVVSLSLGPKEPFRRPTGPRRPTYGRVVPFRLALPLWLFPVPTLV